MSEAIARRLHGALEEAAETLRLPERDGPRQLAAQFGIGGYVARHLDGRQGDEPAAERAAVRYYETMFREAAQEIARLLARRGVRHFFFKGVALVGRVYEPGDRAFADIDLVVDPRQLNAAVAALYTLGYVALREPDQPGPATLRPGLTMHRPGKGTEFERILLDLHWGLEPVTHLLPRADLAVPEPVWNGVQAEGGLPVPLDEHHLALIVHHLAHHDMLHVRGLLDVALLWETLPKRAGGELADIAQRIGVRRPLAAVARVLVDDLALYPLRGVPIGADGLRGRVLGGLLSLPRWLAWAARAEEREHVMITPRRIWRRLLLADDLNGTALGLMGDALKPPDEYLRWRWPNASSEFTAWMWHLGRVAGKLIGR